MNYENVDRLIDRLEHTPWEKYNQGRWCGTACCIGGHACRMEGGREIIYTGRNEVSNSLMETPTGDTVFVCDWAAEILGLTESQVMVLFESTGSEWEQRAHLHLAPTLAEAIHQLKFMMAEDKKAHALDARIEADAKRINDLVDAEILQTA